MEMLVDAAFVVAFVALGFALGVGWRSDTVGQLKHENERLNKELKRWSDRDERGRFKGDKK